MLGSLVSALLWNLSCSSRGCRGSIRNFMSFIILLPLLDIFGFPLFPLLPPHQLCGRHVLLIEPLHAVLTLEGLAELKLPYFEITQVDVVIWLICQVVLSVHHWYVVARIFTHCFQMMSFIELAVENQFSTSKSRSIVFILRNRLIWRDHREKPLMSKIEEESISILYYFHLPICVPLSDTESSNTRTILHLD